MMEFGAIQCAPRQPACDSCPLHDGCDAYANKAQQELPVKLKKTKVRERYFNYFLVRANERLLFRQRQAKDIWQGLYELPLFESKGRIPVEQVKQPILDQLTKKAIVFEVEDKIHRHVLSHQVLHVSFVVISIEEEVANDLVLGDHHWYSFNEAEALPKPVLIANYLDSYLNSIHLQEEKN
jgi:A/G-specific adenine glycosylase